MSPTPRARSRSRRDSALVPETSAEALVLMERRGPVALLTLNHPPVNVLTNPLLEQLAGHVLKAADDPSVRVIIIASALKGFSGGADIKAMAKMSREEASALSTKGQAVANLLERSPLPVIAAVNGYCFGGGSELSQACDFIIASEDAVFGQPEILIGVIPGWGGSRRLTRAVGVARARRWIMTGEQVSAKAAFEYGLVDRIVPKERLLDEALALADVLVAKPAVALAAAKYAVNQASDPSRLLGLEYERELWGLLFETEDQKEGMNAFLEKRSPRFPDQRDWTRRRPEFPWERPGNPLETAREEVYVPTQSPAPSRGRGTGPGPFDVLAMAEAYREAGLRAFQAFFALMRNATDSYRYWADIALRDSEGSGSRPPRSSGDRARKG